VPYPKSTEGLAEFHRSTAGPHTGIVLGDEVYYDLNTGNVVPLEIDALPFGYSRSNVGHDDPRYYHIEGTQDWIYQYWKSTWSGASMSMLYRADIEMPSPERATQLCITTGVFPRPGHKSRVLLTLKEPAMIHAAAQALQSDGVPWHTLRLRSVGCFQFRSPEYPGVAISHPLHRDSLGQYYLFRVDFSDIPPQFLACPLDGELSRAIHETLLSR